MLGQAKWECWRLAFQRLYALTSLLTWIYFYLQTYIHISTLVYMLSPLIGPYFSIFIYTYPPYSYILFIFQFWYVHIFLGIYLEYKKE